MNALIIAAIVLGSIAVYLVAGFATGRSWARFTYKRAYYDREFNTKMAFVFCGLLWPITALAIIATNLWLRHSSDLIETLIPEVRQKADAKRQRELEADLENREREIARLHRELGIKP